MAGTIVWFQQDLRLDDNPAVFEAVRLGGPVVCVYVWSPEADGSWSPGAAGRWWLHHALVSLDRELRRRRSRLIVRVGEALAVLKSLVAQTGATGVYWNRRYEPRAKRVEQRVCAALQDAGVKTRQFSGALLFEPEDVLTGSGTPYQVFTPFWRAIGRVGPPASPVPAPDQLPRPRGWPTSVAIDELGLLPAHDWAGGLGATWSVGEGQAHDRLTRLCTERLAGYDAGRDRLDQPGTSELSPYLHWGQIGPRRVWHTVMDAGGGDDALRAGATAYLRQLAWREFAYHLLYRFPNTAEKPLRKGVGRLPWRRDKRGLRAWQLGKTGYPVVDAGMRQLWRTGWMHNRARMVVASFLVKDLLVRWQDGARWFWDTLVDADLANNTFGWQWVAGCGADASPFYRIFNPVTQGKKFDASGAYVRRWVPELAAVPDRWLHCPWSAPAEVLIAAGVTLGRDYPCPVVDHAMARQRALAAIKPAKGAARGR